MTERPNDRKVTKDPRDCPNGNRAGGRDELGLNPRNVPEKPAPKPVAPNPLVPIRSADDLIRDDVTDEMKNLARTDPERVAKLLRDWMARR